MPEDPKLESSPDMTASEAQRQEKWNSIARDKAIDEAKTEYCLVCRFYDVKHPMSGLCRRYAPPAMAHNAAWPVVGKHDWCGEFLAQ